MPCNGGHGRRKIAMMRVSYSNSSAEVDPEQEYHFKEELIERCEILLVQLDAELASLVLIRERSLEEHERYNALRTRRDNLAESLLTIRAQVRDYLEQSSIDR